jgi:Tol biopolymer transport system component
MHTWTMQLDAHSSARPFSQHSWAELGARFSPAETGTGPRWIVYTSAETGRYEVYVQDFPSGNRRWPVSTTGGWMPHWRRDGRELFYLALDGTMMSVPVHAGATLELGSPHRLFPTGLRPTPIRTLMNQYAVSQDGQRFLFDTPEDAVAAITAVVGW